MKFRWSPAPPQLQLAETLAAQNQISPLLAQCLLNRGHQGPAAIGAFLEPRLKQLADPFLLPNMEAAVQRLMRAHAEKQPLVLFGDYDVDGVTSTALLMEVLRGLGWAVDCYLPHRRDEGYGLTPDGVENCLRKFPVQLLLAVDCGSNAVEVIADLRDRGVDVIVLDHHQVPRPAPAAVALVNPQLAAQCSPPLPDFTELCSAGLAFKLAHALVKRGRETGLPGAAQCDLKPLLDLVALGTIADLVPLTGENRILVSAGLEQLSRTARPGLVALKEVSQCPPQLGSYEVGFQLAPRLNAAGRLETAEAALHLILAPDLETALPLAQALDSKNRERQIIERAISDTALGELRTKFDPKKDFVIVEGRPLWHIGVVGIVASRVLQQFYRPTIILGGDGESWRGSGRSIPGFDLAAALSACADLLVRHGGHAMAAGVTLSPDHVDAFRVRLNELARKALQETDLRPVLRLDAEVTLPEISLARLAELDRLKPTGQGNPSVQFCVRGVTQSRPVQRMGADKQHVKLWVTDGAVTCECVWWGGGKESLPEGVFDLAFAPQVNAFNGRTTVQLKVLDWAPATAPSVTSGLKSPVKPGLK